MKSLLITNKKDNQDITPVHTLYANNMFSIWHSSGGMKKFFTFKIGRNTIKKIITCEVEELEESVIVIVDVEEL